MSIACNFFDNSGMSYSQEKPFLHERKLLGATIRRIREQKDLTQQQLAEKADIDVSYLAKIENALVNTTVRYLIKISRGLGVQVKDLFEF